MIWLRSKVRKLSLLALFALAVQFGLSFGHVHFDRAFGNTTAIANLPSPASPQPGTDTDGRTDQCAICAVIALAHTLIDASAPVLPVPLATTASDAVRIPSIESAIDGPLGFQSRAPPIA